MELAVRLRGIVDALPPGAAVSLPVDVVRAWLDEEPRPPQPPAALVDAASWRERLWACHPATRLGVRDVAEALDRSADWVYRAVNSTRAAQRSREPLPCAKLDGELVFTAGAVREWVRSSETVVNPITAEGDR